MKKDIEWYKKQIRGLRIILKDCGKRDEFISRTYIDEKLQMILFEGINFHPAIKEAVGLE